MEYEIVELAEKFVAGIGVRTNTCDFEEYQLDGTKNNCEVHIYIAIN